MLKHFAWDAEAASSQAQWQPCSTPQQPAARCLHPHTHWPMSSSQGSASHRGSVPSPYQPHITVDLSALQGPTQHLPALRTAPAGSDSWPHVGASASRPSSPGWQHQHQQDARWQTPHATSGRKQGWDSATGAQEHVLTTAGPQGMSKPAVSSSEVASAAAAAAPVEWLPTGRGSSPSSPYSSRPASPASGWRGTDENALQQRGIRKQWKARPPGCD